ncbi:MAG: acetylornithine/succinylornithine family transaminase [Gammaproteobacteria bacterium]|nr:acetylornithine/succinylornithine family transaminase [Gammaproteobacteria bacterium]
MHGAPSAESQTIIDAGQAAFLPNYAPAPFVLNTGEGARVWDTDGNEYVDLGAGIAVSSLGHQDPELVAAAKSQLDKLWHVSNLYWTEPPVRLCEELVASAAFAKRAFLCNSGAEANEAAIKLARKWASATRPPQRREIITFEGGFHGRTIATVTATAQPKYHAGFEPLPGGFVYCPFNDFDAVAGAVSERTCAIMVEPVQGEGGIHPAAPGFLEHLRVLCDANDALLIFDEIQSGMGRTGRLYAHQWAEGVEPDIMTLAKALGCGLPIGAMLAGARVAELLQPGSHGSTFGGNPVACAVARVVLKRMSHSAAMARVNDAGERTVARLRAFGQSRQLFSEVRGRGLMIGATLREPYAASAVEVTEIAARHGVLVLVAGADVVRLVPPLSITDEELDAGLTRLEAALDEMLQGQSGAG